MSKQQHARKVAIVGGGIAGLAAAVFVRKLCPDHEVLLFESEARLGGVVSTDHYQHIALERGPLSISADDPKVHQLLAELHLTDALEPADGLGERFIYSESKLRKVSFDPRVLVREGLLSRRGAARAMMEPLIKARRPAQDDASTEAVWDFFARRFGSEVSERLVQPLLLGITTGEARDTDMQTLFPGLVQREVESGSVLGAFFRESFRRERKSVAKQYWLRGKGLQMIADAVAKLPGVTVHLDTRIRSLQRGDGSESASVEPRSGYALIDADQQRWLVDDVILATPASVSGQLLKELAPIASRELLNIDSYSMALVNFVYRRRDLERLPPKLQFLVRRGQGLRMIGAQWSSDVFPDQAPHEYAVLRCLYGGEFDRHATDLTRAELIRTARVELATILGLETIPLHEHVVVWPGAIPHFRPGHPLRCQIILSALEDLPGVQVIGSGVSGLSVPACVAGGYESARRLAAMTV